jgi:MFS family permease
MGESDGNSGNDCPLSRPAQTRNLLLFAACTGLVYLTGPISYVGPTQASLCRELGSSDATANLPKTLYLALTVSPVVFAWLVPYVAWLKCNLMICFGVTAAAQAGVALTLLAPVLPNVKIVAVILQSGLAGILMPSAIAFLWELVGRGVSESRRGLAMSLAFGVGPLLAVIGSLGSQWLLSGELAGTAFPRNFVFLYGAAAPIMALAAILVSRFVVPLPAQDAVRRPFVQAVFGGLWDFLSDRLLLTATIVTILIYTGNTIDSNLNLYSKEVYGDAPMLHAGNQNAMRFGFKMIAGLLLGWVLTRTNPKVGLLLTAITFVGSLLWALVAPPAWYVLVFGIYGAGELVGAYAPNYILSASRQEDLRRNMAFVTMMMAPAAPAGYLFGTISDVFGKQYGKAVGFQISFAVCAALMAAGILLAIVALPARPGAARDEPKSDSDAGSAGQGNLRDP